VSIVGFADAIDLLPALAGDRKQRTTTHDFNTETISNA